MGTLSSDPHIQETVVFDFIARVSIPEINQKGTGHPLLHQLQIEGPKLLPFGDNHCAIASTAQEYGPSQ
jgi:hypothetical protein